MASGTYRDIVDFLVKPDNIESALDLGEVVPRALDRLHVKFWKTTKEMLEGGLRERGVTGWTPSLWGDDEAVVDPEDLLKARWGHLELTWNLAEDELPLYWTYWVQQDYRTEKGVAPLTYGLGFYSEDERRMRQQGAKLPAWAQELYDHPGVGWKSDKDHLKWGWVLYAEPGRLRGRSETIRLAQGDELENEIATGLFELFEKTHKNLEAENSKNRSPAAPRKRRRD